jgi:hypothetical protein
MRSDGLKLGAAVTAAVVLAAAVALVAGVSEVLPFGWAIGGLAGLVGGFVASVSDPRTDGRALGATTGALGNLAGGVLGSALQAGVGLWMGSDLLDRIAEYFPEVADTVLRVALVGFGLAAAVGILTGTACALVGGLLGGAVGDALRS